MLVDSSVDVPFGWPFDWPFTEGFPFYSNPLSSPPFGSRDVLRRSLLPRRSFLLAYLSSPLSIQLCHSPTAAVSLSSVKRGWSLALLRKALLSLASGPGDLVSVLGARYSLLMRRRKRGVLEIERGLYRYHSGVNYVRSLQIL